MRLVAFAFVVGCRAAPAPVTATAGHAPPPLESHGRVVVSSSEVETFEPIRFDGLSATLLPGSRRALDALARTLAGNPAILLVEVRAFGADGLPAFQLEIGERRARAVVDALIHRGVSAKRLRSRGLAQPPQGTSAASPVFEIIERAPDPP